MGTPPIAIEVRAEPITAFDSHDPSRRRFGQLEFRGGLTLTSTYWEFSGLSAIRLASDGGHFISLSDHGRLFMGRLTHERTLVFFILARKVAVPADQFIFGKK